MKRIQCSKKNLKRMLALGLLIRSVAQLANADPTTLGTYAFSSVVANTPTTIDPTPPPTPPQPGLEFGAFSAIGVGASPRANEVWSFSSWSIDSQPDLGKYYQATLTPLNGTTLDLDSIRFDVRRSASGPRNFVLRSSVDGFASDLPGAIQPPAAELSVNGGVFQFTQDEGYSTSLAGPTVALPPAFDALTQPVTFRLYAFGAEQSGGTFAVDNFAVQGSMAAVPEPEEYAAAASIATLVYGVTRKLKRRAPASSQTTPAS